MNRYTLHCTEEQTKNALALGAPLKIIEGESNLTYRTRYEIPTAEQLIGWLEDNLRISDIDIYRSGDMYWAFYVTKFCGIIHSEKEYFSRKEATLAAIDAALEYLSNKK